MLAKKHKIINRGDIPNILNNGESINTPLFVVKFIYNKDEINRFGVITSLKISKKAVNRNRIRRRIYEAIRLFLKDNPNLKKSVDAIILTKKSSLEADFKSINSIISNILAKILQ